MSPPRDLSGGLVVSLWNPRHTPDARGRRWQKAGFLVTQGPSAGFFAYFPDYDGPPLDPIHLDYRREPAGAVFQPPDGDRVKGLPGAFYDALPGRFGMAVLVRHFPAVERMAPATLIDWFGQRAHSGLLFERPGQVTPERYVGTLKDLDAIRGPALALSGARPVSPPPAPSQDGILYLEAVRERALRPRIQEMARLFAVPPRSPGDEERLYSTTSAGGAQPKCFVKLEGRYWLAKFNAPGSPIRLEHALLELARASGIDAPRSMIVTLPESGEEVLLIERYDRTPTSRAHRISAQTLLGLPHTAGTAAGDTRDLLALAGALSGSRDGPETWEMLRRALFQAGASVSDNHLRNFEWMINSEGRWVPTPLFDLAPNPGSEFATPLCGLYTQKQILTPDLPAIIARKTGLPAARIAAVCAETAQRMVAQFDTVRTRAGLSGPDAATLQRCVPVSRLHALAAQWSAPAARPAVRP